VTILDTADQLGPIIRDARKAKGWSQQKLAERCAVDRSYISRIEKGFRSASFTVVIAALAELGLSLQVVKR
jgi:transcriptional regulator with XRE-family HTH domain